ncbi:glycosyltransferase family 2 protein [Desulfopila sp. IMCC35008]|uniref:glycosyltransferase family 2 protein n=1 Tax=Desulfopila sp. IMCC35008 TaxID=2653858 RepID=UPI0013D2EE1F|nr:glycosyltransferase family 2 protein [Desulfopila sp. IMCC35008]
MPRHDPIFEIIIPNWNGKQLLAECLQSLRKQTSQEFSVTVVDNGSTDGSVQLLQEEYPEVNLVCFDQNRGFSVAVNAGICQSSTDWIFLLNNDIEVAPTCIEELLKGIQAYPSYDSFALRMMSFNQRDVFDGAGDAVLRGGVGYRIGTMEKGHGQYDNDRDVFGACGGAALYSRKFFKTVGIFDEDFFAYLEDVDLNMRAVKAGLKCKYLASATVYHIGSASTGSKINPMTIRLSTKNNWNVLVKNYPASLLFRLAPVIAIYQFMWFLFVCKKLMIAPYFQGLNAAVSQYKRMKPKRRDLAITQTITDNDFARLLKESEREAVQSIMDRRSEEGKSNHLLNIYRKLFLR